MGSELLLQTQVVNPHSDTGSDPLLPTQVVNPLLPRRVVNLRHDMRRDHELLLERPPTLAATYILFIGIRTLWLQQAALFVGLCDKNCLSAAGRALWQEYVFERVRNPEFFTLREALRALLNNRLRF